MHGDSYENVSASFARIAVAARLAIPQTSDKNALLGSVREWLDSSESGTWLMVVDNLDDIRLNFEYFPRLRGAILFTSRDGRIRGDVEWAVRFDASVELLQMSISEAFEMCANMGLGVTTEYAALAELLELLGYLPLAIAQAVAYICRCGIDISDYLNLFKASAERQEQLLTKSLKPGRPDTRVIMATWKVTLDQIKIENAVAVDILEFMSALNPDDIPLELICVATTFKEHDQLEITESIGVLIAFSLLSRLDHSSSYRLHRLVSFVTQRLMNMDLNAVADAVGAAIPADQQGELLKCSRIMPHAIAVENQMQQKNQSSEVRFQLQHNVASIMIHHGEYRSALEW